MLFLVSMKHVSGFDNIFETESWYFGGNMKALLGHLYWGLSTKGQHSDPVDKTLWVCVWSAMFLDGHNLKWGKNFGQWLLYYDLNRQYSNFLFCYSWSRNLCHWNLINTYIGNWMHNHANWRWIYKWLLSYLKCILKIWHCHYLQFHNNLPVNFAIFLKGSLLLNSCHCLFCKQNLTL